MEGTMSPPTVQKHTEKSHSGKFTLQPTQAATGGAIQYVVSLGQGRCDNCCSVENPWVGLNQQPLDLKKYSINKTKP